MPLYTSFSQVSVPGIVTVSTDGTIIQNTTPATGGVPVQMSPRLKWRGTAWDTAASETVDFFAEVLPATAATPTGTWKLGYSLNGAAATYPMTVSSAGRITALENVQVGVGGFIGSTGMAVMGFPNVSAVNVLNSTTGIGSQFNVGALPTISSGFGTTPGVTAGSTPLAGSVNVGTGGVATSGVINFNGTAFPSAPFCTATPTTSNVVQRVSSTTTQLTLTVTTAWTASDIIFYQCISAK